VTDDLSAPLGQHQKKPRHPAIRTVAVPLAAALFGGFALLFLGWAIFADAPPGEESMAVVRLDARARSATEPGPADADARGAARVTTDTRPNRYDGPVSSSEGPVPPKTITIIDGTNGKRQEVPIPGQGAEKSATDPIVDPRFSESSRQGPIPKIAPDGTRPAEAFAQAVKPLAGRPNAPRVAIIVAGLGISAAATAEALAKLPGSVTFALAPYGAELDRLAVRARAAGHELLLQVPMEPFDYPDNDPGPQTLLASLDGEQNVDRLRSLMSRLQGYVGVANFMGARFLTAEQALAPILRETARRGLIFVEDGSAPRSVAGEIASANNLPYAKADLAIDAVPAAAEIDRTLSRLERTARERGSAVGIASALPASIAHIASWAKGAEARGVLLVPISAIAMPCRMSDAGCQRSEDKSSH
jgi:polysaccharide deacetylase 2 family uncharacterized protein YibQ